MGCRELAIVAMVNACKKRDSEKQLSKPNQVVRILTNQSYNRKSVELRTMLKPAQVDTSKIGHWIDASKG